MTQHRLVVTAEEAGLRLDLLLAQRIPGLSRRAASALCIEGEVSVDGRRGTKGAPVAEGTVIIVTAPEAPEAEAEPGAPLEVVLERADLIIVDKPAGQPTAPLRGGERGTLVNALLAAYPELAGVGFGRLEPGIVHRLDNHTSGLVIAARNAATFRRLRDAIAAETLAKRYLAVVTGGDLDPSGQLSAPIAPHPRDARRVVVLPPGVERRGARPACTTWRVVAQNQGCALLEVSAPRAVRHQIRAHLAAVGHPIVGDVVYGGLARPSLGERHALHASDVRWAGDDALAAFSATSPLPRELSELVGG